jgi:hypothetical protein
VKRHKLRPATTLPATGLSRSKEQPSEHGHELVGASL